MTLPLDPFWGLADNGAAFARTVLDVHGEAGQGWLSALPTLLIDYAQRWSLKLLPPFALSYHYVAPAIRAMAYAQALHLAQTHGRRLISAGSPAAAQ